MSSYDGKEAARQVWGASPAGWVYGEGAAIGTREYFENVIRKRSTYELPWLAEDSSPSIRREREKGFGGRVRSRL